MTPFAFIITWIFVGFFVSYKWKFFPLLPAKDDPESRNVLAFLIIIAAPLSLAISLFIIIFVREWDDKK